MKYRKEVLEGTAMLEREAMAVLVSAAGISYGRREMALRAAGSATALLADPFAYTRALGE